MKTKHIRGWSNSTGDFVEDRILLDSANHVSYHATLTIWDGAPERLYTESQVRAFIAALKDETTNNSVDQWIDNLARKCGLLDPA